MADITTTKTSLKIETQFADDTIDTLIIFRAVRPRPLGLGI